MSFMASHLPPTHISAINSVKGKDWTFEAYVGDLPLSMIYPQLKEFCEAQGKGRAKGRPRKVIQWSFMDGGWWMVDILSLMLYIKIG